MMEQVRSALSALGAGNTSAERWLLFQKASLRLLDFRRSLGHLERHANLSHRLVERMWDAEQDVRIILSILLDTLNDLRDSGLFDELADSQVLPPRGEVIDFPSLLKQGSQAAKAAIPGFDDRLIAEAAAALTELQLRMTMGDRTVIMETAMPPRRVEIPLDTFRRRAGHLGRVSSHNLFCADHGLVLASFPMGESRLGTHVEGQFEDAYAEMIAHLVDIRDLMARQTCVTSYFGRPHLRAGPPAAIAVVAILVVSLAAIGLGFWLTHKFCGGDEENAGLCILGAVLAGLGALVFTGQTSEIKQGTVGSVLPVIPMSVN